MPFNRTAALRALHAEAKAKGFDHDGLRDLCASLTGIPVDKLTLGTAKPGRVALTDPQLSAILDNLKRTRPGAPIPVANAATKPQLWKIREQAKALGWEDPARLAGFLLRQCGKNRLRDLTKFDAVKVIDGLKNLIERGITSGQ